MTVAGEIMGQVDKRILMSHMDEVAKWTKLSGTPTELESLKHFERTLAEYGFDVKVLMNDAYISLPGEASLVAGNRSVDCITHSFSRTTGPDGLTAPVAYLGDGKPDDFAKQDVTGKIVLVHGIAAPEISRRASRAGAVGQIQISTNDMRYEMCISPVWGSPSADTIDELPKTAVVSVNLPDGNRLIEAFENGVLKEATIRTEVDTGWRKTPLLVAEMAREGGSDEDPFVMLSGHHDTWYYGVMDNGSANATMLEVARIAANQRKAWRRGLRLCFWSGHSHGRYAGSAWYADTHWDELDRRCVAHVNVDSTGGINATEVHTTASMSLLRHLAAEAVETHTGQTYTGKRRGRSGDDSFGGIGVPSMFGPISEQDPAKTIGRKNLGWWWHTPEDLLDKIDPDLLVRDTRVVGHALWRLLTEPVLPIDTPAQIEDLRSQLQSLEGKAGTLSFDGLLGECAGIVEAYGRLAAPAVSADRANAAIVAASRALVPMDYSSGDRFQHEPAVPISPWPSLDPVRRYAAADPKSEEAAFLRVEAVRAINRVHHALRSAREALEGACAGGRTPT